MMGKAKRNDLEECSCPSFIHLEDRPTGNITADKQERVSQVKKNEEADGQASPSMLF